jgi:hypothetical protein
MRRSQETQYVNRRFTVAVLMGLAAGAARSEVDLRIEAWPRTAPIRAFARVTEGDEPAAGLARTDFEVTLDGQPIGAFELLLPAALDSVQSLSIVYVQADGRAMEEAIPAVMQMDAGDFAAVVRARYPMAGGPTPEMHVLPFTPADGGAGTQALVEFLTLTMSDRAQLRYGSMVSHTWWLAAGLDQLESPGMTLPPGPKAIILQGNGRYVVPQSSPTQSELVARANDFGIPVFSLATTDLSPSPVGWAFMTGMAASTGGRYLQDSDHATILSLLGDAYSLVIPSAAVPDCDPHMLEVTVLGETASAPFERCDRTPDPLAFEEQAGVEVGSVVVSNTVAITGIEAPVEISVFGGEYSLGCTPTFTALPGVAMPGDLVCIRHTASREPGVLKETTLIVGGVGSAFYSSTGITDPPSGGGGGGDGGGGGAAGGGGAIGLWELLVALTMLLGLRIRRSRT